MFTFPKACITFRVFLTTVPPSLFQPAHGFHYLISAPNYWMAVVVGVHCFSAPPLLLVPNAFCVSNWQTSPRLLPLAELTRYLKILPSPFPGTRARILLKHRFPVYMTTDPSFIVLPCMPFLRNTFKPEYSFFFSKKNVDIAETSE